MMRMHWMASGAAAVAAIAGLAAAQPQHFAGGEYSGAYTCSQGLTGMTVSLRPLDGDLVDATITFYAHPDNPSVDSGCYGARGRLDRATGQLPLRPGAWIYRPGPSWSTTRLDGRLDATGSAYAGRVIAPGNPTACTTFALRRDARPLKAPPPQCVRPLLVG